MSTTERELSAGQIIALSVAAVPMAAVGAFGGWGTYTNVNTEFNRSATAAGAVAAGEGVTLVLALTMFALTLFGQASPRLVHLGLWAAPIAAAAMSYSVADTRTERIVYALTPLAMCGAAEGLGLLARRVAVYSTGSDADALRRNADVLQRLTYYRAKAQHHPSGRAKTRAERRAWQLLASVGQGDLSLGEDLVGVQRSQLTQGAGVALTRMLAATHDAVSDAASDAVPMQLDAEDDAVPAIAPLRAVASDDAAPLQLDAAGDAEDDAAPLQLAVAGDAVPVELLSVAAVADLKGVSTVTVRSWVRRNKLKPAERDTDGRLWFHPGTVSELG
jgi:hypothetical protein